MDTLVHATATWCNGQHAVSCRNPLIIRILIRRPRYQLEQLSIIRIGTVLNRNSSSTSGTSGNSGYRFDRTVMDGSCGLWPVAYGRLPMPFVQCPLLCWLHISWRVHVCRDEMENVRTFVV